MSTPDTVRFFFIIYNQKHLEKLSDGFILEFAEKKIILENSDHSSVSFLSVCRVCTTTGRLDPWGSETGFLSFSCIR